jgi:hypothetical protein
VTLLADLDAFYQEHEFCGHLDAAVEDDRVCMTRTCGAGHRPDARSSFPGSLVAPTQTCGESGIHSPTSSLFMRARPATD